MLAQIALFFASALFKTLSLTTIVGGGCLVLWFLAPVWLTKVINTVHLLWAGIAILGFGVVAWYYFHAGEEHMAKRIAARDAAAIQRVNVGREEVESCNGGVDWDVVTGSCNPTNSEEVPK